MDSDKKVQALKMAKITSIELLESTRHLYAILETCKNICKLAGISDQTSWLDLEINGYLVKYKTREDLLQNLPPYRKTGWKYYDLYGKPINLSPSMTDVFGISTVHHTIKELENNDKVIVEAKYLEPLNKFISEHGMDQASKSLRIHEARISKEEIQHVLHGVKKRIQELLDMIISLLEIQ
ncbi:MAG: hypothetical protein D4R90_03535 [Nitrosopumilales archaeon]|nr:MAG: hypothetical protein D4R90_03535 [Nitrosopumilales archaeon]